MKQSEYTVAPQTPDGFCSISFQKLSGVSGAPCIMNIKILLYLKTDAQ
jgi:hypothetical protein